MSLKLLKLTFVEASIAAVALMLTIASTFIYLTAKPRVDMILLAAPLACSIAILAAEYLSGEIKIDLTPLGSAPTAYTLYYITSEY
ncbi:MAG: hypothetical protein P3X22_006795, partial [Thermoprotei archaeon]|nr:hypothetical protein [Thermoprotei archaeon]